MSYKEYKKAMELNIDDTDFYAFIMGAMLKADSNNIVKLRSGWPSVWEELQKRYDAPGGRLEEDEVCTS